MKDGPPEMPEVVYDVSTAPQPRARVRLAWWQYGLLALAVVIVVPLVSIGTVTALRWSGWVARPGPAVPASATAARHKPVHKPVHLAPPPSPPAYDLPGFQAALQGPEAQVFTSALGKLRADLRSYDFTAAATDAPALVNAANAYLAALRATRPPPSYQGEQAAYEHAAVLARRAGRATQAGLTTVSLTRLALLQKGQALAAQAAMALAAAPGNAPRGS